MEQQNNYFQEKVVEFFWRLTSQNVWTYQEEILLQLTHSSRFRFYQTSDTIGPVSKSLFLRNNFLLFAFFFLICFCLTFAIGMKTLFYSQPVSFCFVELMRSLFNALFLTKDYIAHWLLLYRFSFIHDRHRFLRVTRQVNDWVSEMSNLPDNVHTTCKYGIGTLLYFGMSISTHAH